MADFTKEDLYKEALKRGLISKDDLLKEVEKRGLSSEKEMPPKTVETPQRASLRDVVGGALGGVAGFAGQRSEQDRESLEKVVENRIADRQDLLKESIKEVKEQPLKSAVKIGISPSTLAATVAGGVTQRAEAAVSNAAMALANGKSQDIATEFVKGVKGERLGRAVDLLERSGVPKTQAEMAAIATEILSGKLIGGVGKITGSVASKSGKKLASVVKGVKDFSQGAKARIGLSSAKRIKRGEEFAQGVRNSFWSAKRAAGESFAESLDMLSVKNPNKKVVLGPAVRELVDEVDASPATSRLIANARKKSKVLDDIMSNPKIADDLTLRQVIELKNDIRRVPSLKGKLAKGAAANYTVDDIPIVDFLDDVKLAQLDAFPEMSDVNKAYATVMKDYKLVKSQFNEGKLTANVKNNFGGDPEVLGAINRILSPSVMAKIGGFQAVSNLLKAAGIVGGIGIATAVGKKVFGE